MLSPDGVVDPHLSLSPIYPTCDLFFPALRAAWRVINLGQHWHVTWSSPEILTQLLLGLLRTDRPRLMNLLHE